MNHDNNRLQCLDDEQKRACQLGLWGLLPLWHDLDPAPRTRVCDAQTAERYARSLTRRADSSRIGIFKPVDDFDWDWPEHIDRQAVEELLTGSFLAQAVNPRLIGATGTGNSMLAKNIAHGALLRGRTARLVSVADLLADLARNAGGDGRSRALRRSVSPALLVLDDLGQTAYDNGQADALFTVIAARHLRRSGCDFGRAQVSLVACGLTSETATRGARGHADAATQHRAPPPVPGRHPARESSMFSGCRHGLGFQLGRPLRRKPETAGTTRKLARRGGNGILWPSGRCRHDAQDNADD